MISGTQNNYLLYMGQLMFPGNTLVAGNGPVSASGLSVQSQLDDALNNIDVSSETEIAQFTTAAIQSNEIGSLLDVVADTNGSIDTDDDNAQTNDATQDDVADLALTFDAEQLVGPSPLVDREDPFANVGANYQSDRYEAGFIATTALPETFPATNAPGSTSPAAPAITPSRSADSAQLLSQQVAQSILAGAGNSAIGFASTFPGGVLSLLA